MKFSNPVLILNLAELDCYDEGVIKNWSRAEGGIPVSLVVAEMCAVREDVCFELDCRDVVSATLGLHDPVVVDKDL